MKNEDYHNLTAKDIKKLHIWLRALIQVLYFLFIPSVYTAAFAGVKYIFTQIGAGEKVAVTSFVTVLVVICIYTILFGRFFCGFACAFGTLGDGVHALYVWICKKRKKKPLQIADAWTEKHSLSEIYCTGTDFNFVLCRHLMEREKEPARGMYFPCSMQATLSLADIWWDSFFWF